MAVKGKAGASQMTLGAHINDLVGVCHCRIAMEEVQALCGEAASLIQQLLLEGTCSQRIGHSDSGLRLELWYGTLQRQWSTAAQCNVHGCGTARFSMCGAAAREVLHRRDSLSCCRILSSLPLMPDVLCR